MGLSQNEAASTAIDRAIAAGTLDINGGMV